MTRHEYYIGDLVRIFCDDELYKDTWAYKGKIGVVIKKEEFDS
jgi:hypothetical protein